MPASAIILMFMSFPRLCPPESNRKEEFKFLSGLACGASPIGAPGCPLRQLNLSKGGCTPNARKRPRSEASFLTVSSKLDSTLPRRLVLLVIWTDTYAAVRHFVSALVAVGVRATGGGSSTSALARAHAGCVGGRV